MGSESGAARVALPVVERTEFGFRRTRCGCPDCSVSCRYVPGFLVPADLKRLMGAAGMWEHPVNRFLWACAHLRASPGALVAVRSPGGGWNRVRVPTLVPARQADGMACHWLAADGGCGVHDNSPYGCAMFDAHLADAEANQRSMAGIQAVAAAWNERHEYAELWEQLTRMGLSAPGPNDSRQKMQEEIGVTHPAWSSRPESRDE